MQLLASASSMWRHANCAGNRILERSLRDRGLITQEETTPEATVGQRIHAALEGMPEELDLDEEDVKDRCEWLAEKATAAYPITRNHASYETRLYYKKDGVIFFTGKPDRVYYGVAGTEALNINFKTGRKESMASHLNLQLRTEVVLIYHSSPEIVRIGATIVEPLVNSTPEIVIYDEAALKEAEREILRIVDKTEWVEDRKAGKWCEHCPCRAFCPEAKALALAEPLYVFTETLPRGEAGAKRLETLELAYSILDAQWEAYKTIVQTEINAIPGWHISNGKGVRYVKDVDNVSSKINTTRLIKRTIAIKELEEYCAGIWKLKGKKFKEKFRETFSKWIGIKQTEGGLERIPKRLLE